MLNALQQICFSCHSITANLPPSGSAFIHSTIYAATLASLQSVWGAQSQKNVFVFSQRHPQAARPRCVCARVVAARRWCDTRLGCVQGQCTNCTQHWWISCGDGGRGGASSWLAREMKRKNGTDGRRKCVKCGVWCRAFKLHALRLPH